MPAVQQVQPLSGAHMAVFAEGGSPFRPALPAFDVFNNQTRTIELANRGTEPFTYTATASAPWIHLSQMSGTVANSLTSESLWSTERYLNFAPKLFEDCEKPSGEDVHLLHDVHHRLTPIEAARLGNHQSRTTCSGWKTHGTGRLRKEVQADSRTYDYADCDWRGVQQHLGFARSDPQSVDRLLADDDCARWRVDAPEEGSRLCGAVSCADRCHGATDLSPVTMAAAVHFGLTEVPDFGIQELCRIRR